MTHQYASDTIFTVRHTERTCRFTSFDLGDAAKYHDAEAFEDYCEELAPVGFRLESTMWGADAYAAHYVATSKRGRERLALVMRAR